MNGVWFALHTGDPGVIGGLPLHEASFVGYQRVRAARNGFLVEFPESKGGGLVLIDHLSALSEAGQIVFAVRVTPPIRVDSGVTAQVFLDPDTFEMCAQGLDLIDLFAMRAAIADADHPARAGALRALDRLRATPQSMYR